ncbi:MAG: hypothetical protein OXC65_01440 [Thiotrichales bacterium]|nr:hypothetical protein [Thiotrichales bacterium]
MTPCYVVRTVDEDWIDLCDAPAHLEEKRAAWTEAQRRVRAHPALTTVVLDHPTGALLWQSAPDRAPQFEVVAVDATVGYALETDLSVAGEVLSSHTDRDTAWTAFHAAVAELVSDELIVLRDAGTDGRVLACFEADCDCTDAA